MASFSCPSPVLGCALRVTRLNECGVPLDPLTPNSRIQTQRFVSVEAEPNSEDSTEIMLANACSAIDTLYYTPKRMKSMNVTISLSRVELPLLEMLLDVTLLAEELDPTDFKGYVLRNALTAPAPDPKMLEVQSTNANRDQCGLGGTGSAAVIRHLWPWLFQLEISESLTVNNSDPFTIVIQGIALNNPQWFPSFPGDDFPSWVPGGGSTSPDNVPDGAAPAVNPANVPDDPWTLQDQEDIQAGGPYAQITESDYMELWDCNYLNGGS